MNILLVNLTRFGDLLQSQAAITALNAMPDPAAGESRVGLVCLANFAFAAGFLRGLAHTFPLPKDAFLSGWNEQPGQSGARTEAWLESLSALWRWREETWRVFKPDLVCNLTPTVPARLLSRYLAGAAPLGGFGLDEAGFSQEGAWAAFLRGSTRSRFASPFNVIDLFRAVAGSRRGRTGDSVLRPRPEADRAAARRRLESLMAEQYPAAGAARGFVGLQLGASEERRRWPLEYFVRLGQGLWRESRRLPVLLGSGGERELAGRYAALNAQGGDCPQVSLIGATSLEELAGVLECCSLVVSNDTGTLHLAAGLGRPVLGIFLATAQPWDTGPGLEGSLSLEPDLECHPCVFGRECPHGLRCRRAVSPEEVLRRSAEFLNTGSWGAATTDSGAAGHTARAWLTARDAAGLLALRSLSGHGAQPRSLWMMEQRHFLSQFLDRNPGADFQLRPAEGGQEAVAGFAPEQRTRLLAELANLASQLDLLLARGKVLSMRPLPQFREGFLESVCRLARDFESSTFFPALGFLWRTEMQEQGSDLATALRCAGQYSSLINGLRRRFAGVEPV